MVFPRIGRVSGGGGSCVAGVILVRKVGLFGGFWFFPMRDIFRRVVLFCLLGIFLGGMKGGFLLNARFWL